jgi:site-specific DNA recombinase
MKTNQDKKAVGIWIRVSTEDQARGESPEHHERRARYYAESKGWNIKEVYHLEAVSGKAVIAHPEAQKMLGHIKSGHITGLIFSKLARLARNTRELLDFADLFNESDADLVSLQESIDTSTPAGRLFYTMIAAMAQWEREEIASRVAASVPIRAKLGKPLGGQATFGYCWKDKQLLPEPKEAPVAKLIYDYFLEHRRKKTVARLLNDQGHRTRNGSKFSDTTIDRLLHDPTAKGKHRLNYTKSLGDKKHWVFKPEDEWEYLEVEPIVSAETWNQCAAILKEQEQKHKKPTKRAAHLFTSFVFCDCGGRMAVPSNSPKYTCAKCKAKIPPSDLEAIFHEQLKNFFFSPEEISKHLERADGVIREKQELLEGLENERQKALRTKEKLFRAFAADEISGKTYGLESHPLEQRLEEINAQIPELQGEIDFLKIKYLSSDEIVSEARDLYSKWDELIFEEKRRIIENITDRITIGKDDISISLSYIPSASELAIDSQRNVRGSWPPPPCSGPDS